MPLANSEALTIQLCMNILSIKKFLYFLDLTTAHEVKLHEN